MAADATHDVLPFPVYDARPVRGVSWVLARAAALAVLGWAAATLLAFGYQLAAEQALSRAAAAGLREAALPRASCRSVEQTVLRRLAADGYIARNTSVVLQRNGARVSGIVRSAAPDRLSLSLALPIESLLPPWLQRIGSLEPGRVITVTAVQGTTRI